MGAERRVIWFPETSCLEGDGSRSNGCIGVTLERRMEDIAGRGKESMRKHGEYEKA